MSDSTKQKEATTKQTQNFINIAWKIIKWPMLIGIPILVFGLTTWWSLISALNMDVQKVPELRGKTVEEARFTLSSRSLNTVISEKQAYSQEIDKGLVIASNPSAGETIKRGRSVNLILSSGFKRVLVPDLLLKSAREAELLGKQKGFIINIVDHVFSEKIPVGHIIAQDPQPNTAFVNNSLDILVSKGKYPNLVMVPDMTEHPLLSSLSGLRKKGIPVIVRLRGESRDISNNDPFELRRLTVYRQWPQKGSFIDMTNPETVILRVEWRR